METFTVRVYLVAHVYREVEGQSASEAIAKAVSLVEEDICAILQKGEDVFADRTASDIAIVYPDKNEGLRTEVYTAQIVDELPLYAK